MCYFCSDAAYFTCVKNLNLQSNHTYHVNKMERAVYCL